MASLKDCLGKIEKSGNARFWNDADHAALEKLAGKTDDAGAVKRFIEDTQEQLDAIGKPKKSAPKKQDGESQSPIVKEYQTQLKDLDTALKAIELEDPVFAGRLREMLEASQKDLSPPDRRHIDAAVNCLLSLP